VATPRDMEMDLSTGRLLTEWFEFPEYTDEQLHIMACEKVGVDPATAPTSWHAPGLSPEMQEVAKKINAFKIGHKNRRWKNNMTQQEVQVRMNEASKMIEPDNFKFLPDDVRERTGLEINPLWMIECLVRSGLLNPREQVAALKELASFTHSKAASLSNVTVTEVKPEDWLLELAKEEYQQVEIPQPKQPVERGAGPQYESKMLRKLKNVGALEAVADAELADLMAMDFSEWENDPDT
jgi:hypothetical protein